MPSASASQGRGYWAEAPMGAQAGGCQSGEAAAQQVPWTQAWSVGAVPGGRRAVLQHLCFLASLCSCPWLSHILLLPTFGQVCPPRGGRREPLQCQVPIPREVGGRAARPLASSPLWGSLPCMPSPVLFSPPGLPFPPLRPAWPSSSCVSSEIISSPTPTPARPAVSRSLSY